MSILVVGGTKGLGRETALRFAAPGVDVFLNFHGDDEAASRVALETQERGATVHLIKSNIATPAGARRVVAEVAKFTDRLDQLVHCAVDTSLRGDLMDLEPERFAAALQCNGTSLLALVQAASGLLVRGSSIVFVSSNGSRSAVQGYAAVGVAKALGEALVMYLAVEMAPRGIRVNTVAASTLDTESLRSILSEERAQKWLEKSARNNPSGRRVELCEVVDAIEFLCSDRAVMIQGQRLNVDGGFYLR